MHVSMRTDIPAFYYEWFTNRIREGYVRVRTPYNLLQVTEYSRNPKVVDLLVFCSKNPDFMLKYMDLLKSYRTYWYITIIPYEADIEPGLFKTIVSKRKIIELFQQISGIVGEEHIGWKYDPILLNDKYTVKYDQEQFKGISAALQGCTRNCVIGILDLYQKVKRNFPEAKREFREPRKYLGEHMTQQIYENAIHMSLDIPKNSPLEKCAP